MPGQELHHRLRVRHVLAHAHAQRLEPLQELEGVERAQHRADVAQRLDPRLHDPGEVAEGLVEADAVVAGRRLGQPRELAVVPLEPTAVDDHAADARPVPADELGGAVHDDVGAPLDRPTQVRRGEGVVDHQRQAVLVRDGRQRFEVDHVDLGVGHGLGVHGAGARRDRARERLRVVGIDEDGVDAEPAQGDVELGDGAAVEGLAGHELVAGVHQADDGQELGGLTAAGGERADPALERGHALLEGGGGRVHDARVDVAEALQREQVGRVLRVFEHVARGLVDRHRPRPRHRVRSLPGMQRPRVETEGVFGRHSRVVCLVREAGVWASP